MKRLIGNSFDTLKTVLNRSPKMKRGDEAVVEAMELPPNTIRESIEPTEIDSESTNPGIADDVSDSCSTAPSENIEEFEDEMNEEGEDALLAVAEKLDPQIQEERSWKGNPMHVLSANLNIAPPQRGSKNKTTFIKWPLAQSDTHFVPYPSQYHDRWRSENYVDMPFSEESMFPVTEKSDKDANTSLKVNKPRWSLVQKALKKPMKSSNDIQARILEYNRPSQLDFAGLHQFFEEELDPDGPEFKAFFEEILPQMAKLCLELPKLVTQPIPLLGRKLESSVTFSQRQIASLLANAFFCTFPKRFSAKEKYSNYPTINFNRLFSNLDNQHGIQGEKLKCLFHYFRAMSLKKPEDETLVTFHRHFIPYQSLPDWHKSKKQLTELHINAKGTIEDDGFGMLQVDFANALVGGGVLGHGCVQEEIRFLISPELILSRLFTERLSGNECLVVTGFERFSKYSGYASSFKFDGAYQDDTPIDKGSKHRKTRMVAIDALPPGHSSSQYSPQNVQRELNKAFVGFKNYNPNVKNPVAVATGNWGCGAFGGDPQLKGLLQIMAASEARRDVAYFTFSNRKLRDQIHEMHEVLKSRKLTVGQICSMICQYHNHRTKKSSLYGFILEQLKYDADTDEEEAETEVVPNSDKMEDESTEEEAETEVVPNSDKMEDESIEEEAERDVVSNSDKIEDGSTKEEAKKEDVSKKNKIEDECTGDKMTLADMDVIESNEVSILVQGNEKQL